MRTKLKTEKTTIPSSKDIVLAEKLRAALSDSLNENESITFHLARSGKKVENIHLPKIALKLLLSILAQIAQGNTVTLMPVHAELTTQEAADLLNVSRPFLVSLLNDGKIPYRKVGTKRRVLARDIFEYKENIDQQRLKTLEKLADLDQELGIG